MTGGIRYTIEVSPRIPQRLARLDELANDLRYSWDRPTRALFSRLNPALWHSLGHSPKAFLKCVDEQRLVAAADDQDYLAQYDSVTAAYDAYHADTSRRNGARTLEPNDKVAYFCAEFGFHESLPIYSGGLGILAGDHCKAASDMRLPFVAVGLLYRQGYFSQRIDADGNQSAIYTDSDFDDLPIAPEPGADGAELRVEIELHGRRVLAKIWRARIGHVPLYLLDTDIEDNAGHDREIGHRLYGGDRRTRIEQEIVLGVGGVRALKALGVAPTVWHINEGHAAFLILERMRDLIRGGLDLATALESVAANTVFTTHTVVPAGHDRFDASLVADYFHAYCEALGIAPADLLALGAEPGNASFNMTALAIRGARFVNGVSRVHRRVSSEMFVPFWPQIDPAESLVDHVTNAVHVPTFLAPEWAELLDRHVGADWRERLCDASRLERVESIPDAQCWRAHQGLKAQMLHLVRFRVRDQHLRNQGSEAHLDRILRYADPANLDVLTVGFARRFATYKRASLLFRDLDWLRQIVKDPARPMLLIFAGKAHPADQPGQDLIRRISEVARMPEFEGHILLVEDYDLRLGRRLVSGVDVWLNNPISPLEASGTSGMKAAVNGVINLSVTDGWWEEGYDGRNGWAIKPVSAARDPERRDRDESRTLYELLQDKVAPLYYARNEAGYSPEWIRLVKRSIASILPRFNSTRMLDEYLARFYRPAARLGQRVAQDGQAGARSLAGWKDHVRDAWPAVTIRRLDVPLKHVHYRDKLRFEVAMRLGGFSPEDVVVELCIGHEIRVEELRQTQAHRFSVAGPIEHGEHRFVLELQPELCGKLEYRIRAYPYHPLLAHRFELGLMLWL